MRVRRLRKEAAHLEITAFINLIVVLVPFLLSTAVFTRLAVIDLSLPQRSDGASEVLQENHLKLEVVIRKDAIEVGDRIGGLIQRIPDNASGHDLASLAAWMRQLKGKFPDERQATVLAEPDTAYDTLVQVMDAMRSTVAADGPKPATAELFPDISVGDAPVSSGKGGRP